jgi:predicted nucleic acid-binding protein
MIRAVIDTNGLVSGILKEHGAPAAVLALIGDRKITWYASPARSKFSFDPSRLQRALRSLDRAALVVPSVTRTESRNASENRFRTYALMGAMPPGGRSTNPIFSLARLIE